MQQGGMARLLASRQVATDKQTNDVMSSQDSTAKTENAQPSIEEVVRVLREMDEQDATSLPGEPPSAAARWLYAKGFEAWTMANWKQWRSEEADYRSRPPVDYSVLSKHDKQEACEQWELERRPDEYFPVTQVEYDSLLERARGTAATRAASKKAAEDAKAREQAAVADAAARRQAEEARMAKLVIKLKAYQPELQEVDLKPINPTDLSRARRNPTRARRELRKRWAARFEQLPACVQTAWCAYYNERGFGGVDTEDPDDTDSDDAWIESGAYQTIYLNPIPNSELEIYDPDEILEGLNHDEFDVFLRYSKGVRRAYLAIGNDSLDDLIDPQDDLDPEFGLRTIEEVDGGDEPVPDIVPDVIPTGITVAYGLPEGGKSAWLHKLLQCIASEREKFDGIDIQHGAVAYVTLDSGASVKETKPRLIAVRKRLNLEPSRRFYFTDDGLTLNEPAAVDHFIEKVRPKGPFKVLGVDPMFEAVEGSMIGDAVIVDAMKGAKRLIRQKVTESVIITTHEPKGGGRPFGSILLEAGANAVLHVERTGDDVKVAVMKMKNGKKLSRALEYKFEGPFLASLSERTPIRRGRPAADAPAKAVNDLYARIEARLPPHTPISNHEALKRIGDLLSGRSADTRKKQWQRIRKQMAGDGLISVSGRERGGRGPIIERLSD
jgi:hypothetical protein